MVACGILFSAFSIAYIMGFQTDLLEAFHYSLSQGRTRYSPLFGVFFITVVAFVIRWGINKLLNLKGVLYALSYFPACLLLGVLFDLDYDVCHGGGISDVWSWLLPLLMVGYIGLGYLLKSLLRWTWGSFSIPETVNANLFTLLLLCLMTIGIGNSDKHLHEELAMEVAIKRGNDEQACLLGEETVDPSRTMTALRAYVLSKNGQLGERLFLSSQLYGSEGLVFDSSGKKVLYIDNDSLKTYWGNGLRAGERAVDFFRRLCMEEQGSHVVLDYYLSALLLDKQLKRFTTDFEALYSEEDSVPKHYREALFLYNKMFPISEVTDSVMENHWQRYEALKQAVSDKKERPEILRKVFGGTYWWYYQHR